MRGIGGRAFGRQQFFRQRLLAAFVGGAVGLRLRQFGRAGSLFALGVGNRLLVVGLARRLFRPREYRPLDYRLIPTAVFSQPAIATVGLTEAEARAAGHELRVFQSRFRPLKLTLTDDPQKVFMKLVVDAQTDRVLGCHMVGEGAGEIIQGLAVAMKAGATKQVFDDTIGIHPTVAEEFVTLRTAV